MLTPSEERGVNRTSFILGMALLVVAVTMAVTITVRNAPRDAGGRDGAAPAGGIGSGDRAHFAKNSAPVDRVTDRAARAAQADDARAVYQVGLPQEQLAQMPADERAELTARAAVVESKARGQLERMTEEFDLSGEQRRKMFPMLVRSTAGFDPRMQVGGAYLDGDVALPPDDGVHDVLDSEQQAQLEDSELERQAWWQDVFSRLERDLIDSTGGASAVPAATGEEAAPMDGDGEVPVDDGQTVPPPRTGGSLGGLPGQ